MHEFAHIEIPALDTEKAGKFYGNLFHWTINSMAGSDYLLFFTPDGACIGGIVKVDSIPFNETYLNYVEVESIESALEKAEKLGGKVVRGKTQLPPGMGYYAVVGSPDGYCIGIWVKE
jgi:uncharacterized protein